MKTCLILLLTLPLPAAPFSGGIVSFPRPINGANLITNGGFENGKSGWSDNGFVADSSVAHTGEASVRLTGANSIQYAQTASQTLQLKKGVYNLGGWVKVAGLAATTGFGARICLHAPVSYPWALVNSCTTTLKGTSDWQLVEITNFVVSQDTPAALVLDGYGDPDGTVWFDDVALTRAQFPIQAFMLYPNYRGMLFDDQPQVTRFSLILDLPGAPPLSDFVLTGEIADEASGAVVVQKTFPPAACLTASLDASSLVAGRPYLATFRIRKSDGTESYTYPAHRIVKTPASQKAAMTLSFDDRNRFLLRGKPSFLLGVYDSGIGYSSYEQGWEELLTASRRLFELPINFYLNYWYGGAGNDAILPLMNVLQSRGIHYITNANCFNTGPVDSAGAAWYVDGTEAAIRERGRHPAFGGFYAVDECVPSLVPEVFAQYQRMKALDPDGMVLGTLLPDANVPQWREAVDVLATDPYALYGAEPAGGYPLYEVADSAAAVRTALQGSRPFATVIQFFRFTGRGRWPTEAELRGMSYGAIVGGANGLFYWSLGANALAYICDGRSAYYSPSGSGSWCQAKVDNFTNLKNVLTELKDLEPVLTLSDRPDLLAANSNSAIRTRIKCEGRTAYLIAYNSSRSPQSAQFRFTLPISSASIVGAEGAVSLQSGGFTAALDGYGARIYRVTLVAPLPKR